MEDCFFEGLCFPRVSSTFHFVDIKIFNQHQAAWRSRAILVTQDGLCSRVCVCVFGGMKNGNCFLFLAILHSICLVFSLFFYFVFLTMVFRKNHCDFPFSVNTQNEIWGNHFSYFFFLSFFLFSPFLYLSHSLYLLSFFPFLSFSHSHFLSISLLFYFSSQNL